MPDVTSLRYRYNQFFILFVLCSLIYVMEHSILLGIVSFHDNFYNKHFLIEQVTVWRMKMGDRVFPLALMGKDGWMNYVGEGNIDDFQNVRPLGNMEGFGKGLTTLDQYLKSQGIMLVIVVAPNKPTIYPDKIPGQIKFLPQPSKYDNFISFMNDNNLPMVDLRPALWAARKDRDVFYKTDTHWNGFGALVAYTTIINALQSSHPELKPYKTSDLELVNTDPGIREIPSMMSVGTITEAGIIYKPRESFVQTLHPGDHRSYNQFSWIQDSDLPTLLMFHDSYGAYYLNDYLSMNFAASHFVHLGSMSQYLTKEAIRQFKPDIIIVEIAERNLLDLPIYFPDFMRE